MTHETQDTLMDKIVSLCKRRGFIYPGSEIYGGLSGTWDYGPLGVELKNNIRDLWWKFFVRSHRDMYGIDSAVLMNPKVWEASGHVGGFSDPMVECAKCKRRFRADHLIEEKYGTSQEIVTDVRDKGERHWLVVRNAERSDNHNTEWWLDETIKDLETKTNLADLFDYLTESEKDELRQCPQCGGWLGRARQFNMMFKTHVGATQDKDSVSYLRPETAQGMFVNFKNIVDSFHPKLPFGIAQIGKAFRNEIAPRDFLFRAREFEIMEFEYFVRKEEWEKHFDYWQSEMLRWIDAVGIAKKRVSEVKVPKEELAHYSTRTTDLYFDFPFGQKELYGLAYRTDFDLKNHSTFSGQKLEYSEEGGEPTVPHVIEPTFGLDRTVLAVLCSAYTEDEMGGEKRVFLKLKPSIAPIKVAVFPLLKNKPELVKKAQEIYQLLCSMLHDTCSVAWDDNGNIGKRYRRQDEIGTPFCVTVDFDSLEKNDVTIRDRDTGKQERVAVSELNDYIRERLSL